MSFEGLRGQEHVLLRYTPHVGTADGKAPRMRSVLLGRAWSSGDLGLGDGTVGR